MFKPAFNKSAAKDAANSSTDLLSAIVAERPDLGAEMVMVPHFGCSSHTLMFTNEVFKGPKSADKILAFEQECRVLQHLQGQGLPIPEITSVGADAHFYGMNRMAGMALGRGRMTVMPNGQKQELAKDIANFADSMAKAFSASDMQAIFDVRTNVSLTPEKIIAALNTDSVQSMLGDKINSVCDLMQEYIERLKTTKPVAVYSDFNAGNILIDADTNKLAAIIDFGIVHPTVPEAGFISLKWSYGAEFVIAMCDEYSKIAKDHQVSYRDVLLHNLAYHMVLVPDVVRKNDEGGYLAMKNEVGSALEEIKSYPAPNSPAKSVPPVLKRA